MGFVRGRWRGRWRPRRFESTARVFNLLCVSFCFFSACVVLPGAGNLAVISETGYSRSRGTGSPIQVRFPNFVAVRAAPEVTGGAAVLEGARRWSVVGAARRSLGGPGSYPPRCAAKCGDCNPCKPVHVPVPPGTPVITEYYPEAWRCKCGGKLYMP